MLSYGEKSRAVFSLLALFLLVFTSFGCLGRSTQEKADKPPVLATDETDYVKCGMVLKYEVTTSNEYDDILSCAQLRKIGCRYNVNWWLEPKNSGQFDNAPDAEIIGNDQFQVSNFSSQMIDGIPFFGGSSPRIDLNHSFPTRGLTNFFLGEIPIPYVLGLPQLPGLGELFEYVDDYLYYPAQIRLEFAFKDMTLDRLFGNHEIEVPFVIPVPELDGDHHETTGQYDISFVFPVWSLISHYVNVKLWTGTGTLDLWVVRQMGILDDLFKVNIPVVGFFTQLFDGIIRIAATIIEALTGNDYRGDECDRYRDNSNRIGYDFDYFINRFYEYEYFINGG